MMNKHLTPWLVTLFSGVLLLQGCVIDKKDPLTWHPISIAFNLAAETVGFTYRAFADGEVSKFSLSGEEIRSTESIPCFTNIQTVKLMYKYRIKSKKSFDEKIVWSRGVYALALERDIKEGDVEAVFPAAQVRKDLGKNWPGIWKVELQVKGEPRGSMEFRLASLEARDFLLSEAESMTSLEHQDLHMRLLERAESCWPSSILAVQR